MLFLHHISLTHFKNYETTHFHFEKPVLGIAGLNGVGKTNLLDAIYYCCFTKSYFTSTDLLLTGFEKEGFRIEAHFEREGKPIKLVCVYRSGAKKEISLNDIPYEKFSEHIGLLPTVCIAPDDTALINGGSEGRRKFMDTLLSQLDAAYLQQLIQYNKILVQRNSLLKQLAAQPQKNNTLLDVLDHQLCAAGTVIQQQRTAFAKALLPLTISHYAEIAGNDEIIDISYESQLNGANFEHLLLQSREKDLFLQRSNVGIHKDDLQFSLNGKLFRQLASQGQRKSMLFALKLAEYDLLKKANHFAPILLLDDVFEKLDDLRMQNLLKKVCKDQSGQVFITDTHANRLFDAFERAGADAAILTLFSNPNNRNPVVESYDPGPNH